MKQIGQSPKSRPKTPLAPAMFGIYPTLDAWRGAGFALSPEDMRALSPTELQQRAIEQMAAAQQYKPSLSDMLAQMNYRPPVHVPPWMADWYACGDELH